MEREAAERERRWQQLSLSRRITEWTVDHQYSLIVAGWALSVGIAGAVVWRRPFETPTQKVRCLQMTLQKKLTRLLVDCASPYVGSGLDDVDDARGRYFDRAATQGVDGPRQCNSMPDLIYQIMAHTLILARGGSLVDANGEFV